MKRYQAAVPDTLDLAERARPAVNGLVGVMDREHGRQPHQCLRYFRNPPVLSTEPGGYVFLGGNETWGMHLEALQEMRLISGSTQAAERDVMSLRGMVACVDPDNLFSSIIRKVDGDRLVRAEDFSDLLGGARVLMAPIARSQLDPDPVWRDAAMRLARDFRGHAVTADGGYAYYPDGHVGGTVSRPRSVWTTTREPTGAGIYHSKDWYECASNVLFSHGGILQALCRWYRWSGEPASLELAGRTARFMLLPRFWQAEAAVVGHEHAQYEGHIHATVRRLWGLLEYATLAGDERIKDFVRHGYEYTRTFGIARIGLFGEGCTIGDMTALAVKLTDAGVADCWEDVDQYARNHLTELQVPDHRPILSHLEGASAALVRSWEDAEGFFDRTLGLLSDGALHPTVATPALMLCCTYNGLVGYYHAWEGITREREGTAVANLLPNRASPALDVESHLPYTGRATVRNKTAGRIGVRLPRWVDPATVSPTVNGGTARTHVVDRRLVFESLRPRDIVELAFPVLESTATYTVSWPDIRIPGWTEVTRPLEQDPPASKLDYQVSGTRRTGAPQPVFTLKFRGNDLVSITPREDGPGYPLYRGRPQVDATAPIRTVGRVLPDRLIEL